MQLLLSSKVYVCFGFGEANSARTNSKADCRYNDSYFYMVSTSPRQHWAGDWSQLRQIYIEGYCRRLHVTPFQEHLSHILCNNIDFCWWQQAAGKRVLFCDCLQLPQGKQSPMPSDSDCQKRLGIPAAAPSPWFIFDPAQGWLMCYPDFTSEGWKEFSYRNSDF